MVMPLSEIVARDYRHIRPPSEFDLPAPGKTAFEETVEVLRKREFRKEHFIRAASNLGAMLAERMEDAEGWHDTSRIEPAKAQLKERV